MPDLSDDEYVLMQHRIEMLARFLLDTDAEQLQAFIARAEHADAFAPLFDPTLWMGGHGRLSQVITHARAIAKAREVVAAATTGAIR